jgi:hypothetical protein
MTRLIQLSLVLVALLVARRVLYGWLKQEDSLPRLLRQGMNALLLYFAYVALGLWAFSFLAGRGFGDGSMAAAVLLTIGGAIYVGAGIGGLWLYLARHERRRVQ